MAVVIQFRRDNAAEWAAENPVLAEGEIGVELDTRFFKIGDGVTTWRSLPYAQEGPPGDKGDKGDIGVTGQDGYTPIKGIDYVDGAKGDKGDKGDDGDVATIEVGTVTSLPFGTPSTVRDVGTPTAAIFNFELESGEKGDNGDQGERGLQGDKGDKGDTGSVAGSFGVSIDGAGAAITPGVKQYLAMPFACTITGWHLVGTPSGSAVIDVWKAGGALPTVSDTITGEEKPTLSGASIGSDTALCTWTTGVAAGDIVAFNVESCSGFQKLTLTVSVTK